MSVAVISHFRLWFLWLTVPTMEIFLFLLRNAISNWLGRADMKL